MDFSDTTNLSGLVQDCDYLAGSDVNSYPLKNKAASANRYLDEVVSLVLSVDGRWQFDDTNYTDLPIGTTSIVSGQQDYGIDTSMIDITRVELKDSNGNWRLLIPMDQKDLSVNNLAPLPTGVIGVGVPANGANYSLTDFLKTPGVPVYYDKIGNSLFLYPSPNFSQAASLKVYFQRRASYFASSDTNKQPGFAKHLHRFISVGMAYDYALAKLLNQNKINMLASMLNDYRERIKQFYSTRKKDEKVVIIARTANSL